MNIIYTAIVGSKMHGLDTPSSDEDVRYVYVDTLREVLSPFHTEKVKVEPKNDVEAWELRHFVKHLSQGNPTCYEVLKSPLFTGTEWANKLRATLPFYFDTKKIMYAHIGYAEAQLKRYLRKAMADFQLENAFSSSQLSDIWEENEYRRVPKSIVAAYRVLAQGKQLLLTGDFIPNAKEYDHILWTRLMSVKLQDAGSITHMDVEDHLTSIEFEIQELKDLYTNLDEATLVKTVNIEGLKNFLLEVYLSPEFQ